MLEIRLNGRLRTPEDFQNIVLRKVDDYPVRLGDVALVEQGVEDDSLIVRANGQPAWPFGASSESSQHDGDLQAGARADQPYRKNSSRGMTIIVGSDDALFISASIREVLIALSISLALVIVVIVLFLGSFRIWRWCPSSQSGCADWLYRCDLYSRIFDQSYYATRPAACDRTGG